MLGEFWCCHIQNLTVASTPGHFKGWTLPILIWLSSDQLTLSHPAAGPNGVGGKAWRLTD
jgi:hypothetical protein